MVKAVKKVAQGPARYEGKTWFIKLKDKRKYSASSFIRTPSAKKRKKLVRISEKLG